MRLIDADALVKELKRRINKINSSGGYAPSHQFLEKELRHAPTIDPLRAGLGKDLAHAAIRELRGRKGFGWWLDKIDDEIQAEILESLAAALLARLEE